LLITAAALFVTITIRSASLNHLTGAHFCLHTSVRLGCPSDTVCTGLLCFLQGWITFDRVRIPLYRVEMLSRRLECILEGWNALVSVGIPLYRVLMLSRGLVRFRQSWHTFIQR
jgi:hypothetical protein